MQPEQPPPPEPPRPPEPRPAAGSGAPVATAAASAKLASRTRGRRGAQTRRSGWPRTARSSEHSGSSRRQALVGQKFAPRYPARTVTDRVVTDPWNPVTELPVAVTEVGDTAVTDPDPPPIIVTESPVAWPVWQL